MPTTQAQYDAMVIKLRQMGHILEHTPGNVVEGLRSGRRQQLYFTDANTEDSTVLFGQTWSQDTTTPSLGASWYGDATTGQHSSYSYNDQSSIFSTTADPWGPQSLPNWNEGVEGYDSGTDTDTESSVGDTLLNYDDVQDLPDAEKEEVLFGNYSYHKKKYRSYMRKPVRRVRRFVRKQMFHKTKGKGKGKRFGKHRRLSGKGVSTLIADLSDEQYAEVFFGKSKGGKRQGPWPCKRQTVYRQRLWSQRQSSWS
jgi:hypothetical protein